jgi:hypothetical protein
MREGKLRRMIAASDITASERLYLEEMSRAVA